MASWIPSWITGGSAEPHHALKAVVAGLDKELDALRVLDVEVEKQCMVCDNNDAAQADFDALEALLSRATTHTRAIDRLLADASELKADMPDTAAHELDQLLRPYVLQYTSRGAAFARAGRARHRKLSGTYGSPAVDGASRNGGREEVGSGQTPSRKASVAHAHDDDAGNPPRKASVPDDAVNPSRKASVAAQSARYGAGPVLGAVAGGLLLGPPGAVAGLKAGSLVSAAVLGTDMLASRASAQFPDDSDGETHDGPAYTPLPQT